MRNIKNIALALLLLSSSLLLACGDAGDGGKSTDASVGTGGADTSSAETEIVEGNGVRIPLELDVEELAKKWPEEDFTFLSISKELSYGYYSTTDLYYPETSAEPLENAIYLRNLALEETLGMKVKEIPSMDFVGDITRAVNADCEYDAVWGWTVEMYPLAAQGYFLDFNEVEHINLDNRWWDQNLKNDMSVFGKNYIMTGDISTRDDACTCFVYFNKKLIGDYDLPSPYDMVNNDTWTIDKMKEMVRVVSFDENSDGKWTDGDVYGLFSENSIINRMFLAMGGTYCTKNKDGSYEINITEEHNMDIFSAIYDLLYDERTVSNINTYTHTGMATNVYAYGRQLFTQDKFLFHISAPTVIDEFRDMESEFGIIPIPKFDENQTRYYAPVEAATPVVAIPVNVPDEEKSGAGLEFLAWESRYTVTPEYTETLLQRKYTRDAESMDMLELIMENRTYDLMFFANWGDLLSVPSTAYAQGRTVAPSDFASMIKAAEQAIATDMEFFENIEQ